MTPIETLLDDPAEQYAEFVTHAKALHLRVLEQEWNQTLSKEGISHSMVFYDNEAIMSQLPTANL